MTIFWQYFDNILTSSCALSIVICVINFQILLWPVFATKTKEPYLNVRQKKPPSHTIPKWEAKPLFWVAVLVVSVDYPHVDAKCSEPMKNISLHVQIEQFSVYFCQKAKGLFFEHSSIFPHDLQQAWSVMTSWTVMSPNHSALEWKRRAIVPSADLKTDQGRA